MARDLPHLLLATLLGVLASPAAARACAVCQGGTSDNRLEFILTTALLTFTPLALIGGVVWGLRRRYLSLAVQEPRDDVPRVPTAAERARASGS